MGLAIVAPITRQAKGYPFEVPIPHGRKVHGVILADHVECIDWRKRGARLFDTLPAEVLKEVEERLGPLIFP